jgi:hypothetical protein
MNLHKDAGAVLASLVLVFSPASTPSTAAGPHAWRSPEIRPEASSSVLPPPPWPALPETSREPHLPPVGPGSAGPVTSARGLRALPASATGPQDIPVVAVHAYRRAASVMAAADPGCGVRWSLLAAIGMVESDHGRYGGATVGIDGVATPSIIGVPLDGTGPVARIRDSDRGLLDGDRTWDRAVGPMQFIPQTWRLFGVDGDGDGARSPHDLHDAALAAAVFLCVGGSQLDTLEGMRRSVRRYNDSAAYVAVVLDLERAYRTSGYATVPASALGVRAGALPVSPPPSGPEPSGPDLANEQSRPNRPTEPPVAPSGPATRPESPAEAPPEAPTQPPHKSPTEAPAEPATQPPSEPATQPPPEPATQPPPEPATQPPPEPTTEAPAEPATHPPPPEDPSSVRPPSESPSAPPEAAPTQPSGSPTGSPAGPPKDPPSEPPADPEPDPPADPSDDPSADPPDDPSAHPDSGATTERGEWSMCRAGYCLDDNVLDLRQLHGGHGEDRAADPEGLVGATVTVVVLKEEHAWVVLAIEKSDATP